MTLLFLLSSLTFSIYLIVVLIRFGVPASVSDTYYLWHGVEPKLGQLFTAFCVLVAAPLIPVIITISNSNIQFLAFFTAGSLLFVGVAAHFKDDFVHKIHFGAALVCIVASQLWVVLSGLWLIPVLCFVLAGIAALKFKRWMFWVELGAFASTFIAVASML